jgi:hypothetical protein
MKTFGQFLAEKGRCWTGYKPVAGKKPFSPGSCEEVKEDLDEEYTIELYDVEEEVQYSHLVQIEEEGEIVEYYLMAKSDEEADFQAELLETAAWQRKEGKSESGGLNAKGVASYRRENPGSKLKTAVTTKPSKLKKGSKAAKRRKSFCARMGGMKKRLTSTKTARDPDSRINKALRKWNC